MLDLRVLLLGHPSIYVLQCAFAFVLRLWECDVRVVLKREPWMARVAMWLLTLGGLVAYWRFAFQ